MERWLAPWSNYCYVLLRIVAALLYLSHGTQKLFGFPGGHAVVGNPLLQTAGVIELVAGSLIALGLYTSYAAFLASGEMAAAYFMVHIPTVWLRSLTDPAMAAETRNYTSQWVVST